MTGLASMLILFTTIVLSLAIGVGLGHLCLAAILHLMGHRPAAPETAVALQPAQVSGD